MYHSRVPYRTGTLLITSILMGYLYFCLLCPIWVYLRQYNILFLSSDFHNFVEIGWYPVRTLCCIFVIFFIVYWNHFCAKDPGPGKLDTFDNKWHTYEFCNISQCWDPDPVPFWSLDPGSGMGKKLRSSSRMNIPDHISESLETSFWVKILKFFDSDADPDPG